jgi:hypothetical protein
MVVSSLDVACGCSANAGRMYTQSERMLKPGVENSPIHFEKTTASGRHRGR